MNHSVEVIIDILTKFIPNQRKEIGLHEPYFIGNEWNYVKECIDSGWVSSAGKFVDRFEQQLAAFTGLKYAIAVVNGTAALHTCLMLSKVEQKDEVLVPALTFVATANAVTYCGAFPHFVDVEKKTLGIDPVKVSEYLNEIAEIKNNHCYNKITGRRIKAIIAMHTFGHPVDLDPLLEVSEKWNLELIEDAAESLGSYYKGRHTGNWAKVTAISFNGNKVITTGSGGAILTNDPVLAKKAKHLTTTAKRPHPYEFYHDQIGFNYRLPNINAALGCAQLENLPDFLRKKRQLAGRYQQAFEKIDGVTFFTEADFAKSNYWLNTILLHDTRVHQKEMILELSNQRGIMTRPAWNLMHQLPMYKDNPRMPLTVAEDLQKRMINIPSSVFI